MHSQVGDPWSEQLIISKHVWINETQIKIVGKVFQHIIFEMRTKTFIQCSFYWVWAL